MGGRVRGMRGEGVRGFEEQETPVPSGDDNFNDSDGKEGDEDFVECCLRCCGEDARACCCFEEKEEEEGAAKAAAEEPADNLRLLKSS